MEREIKTFERRVHPPGMVVDRWISADGWDHRSWNWPISAGNIARGSAIFQTGRGDFFEKYLESLNEWHEAGWNLCGFDWRGQSGSGRFLKDPTVGHIDSFDSWVADFDEFVAGWRAETPGPHVVMSHSMGGHIVMRYLVEHTPGLDAAIFSAPMLKVVSKPLPQRLAYLIARLFARFGFAEQHAWQENERPSLPGSSRQKLLTHDLNRYADETWWQQYHPELKLGPPSWRWLVSAYASAKAMFAQGKLEKVTTPVLIIAARQDKLVSADAIEEAVERLPNAKLVMDSNALHELLRDSDVIRDPLMAEIDNFLDQTASAGR